MPKPQNLLARTALLPSGWAEDVRIAIDGDGLIAAVTPGATPSPGDLDLGRRFVLPAPSNLHSHTFQRALAGRSEARGPDPADSFWTWRARLYAFLECLTPEHVEAIAALAFMEMLEAGYASVAEFHYLHHRPGGRPYEAIGELSDRVLAAALTAGIGLTLAPVLYQQGNCEGRALAGAQRRFGNSVDSFSRLCEHARGAIARRGRPGDALGIGAHSLRAVSADGLRQVEALAAGAVIHMHVAEQEAEIDEVSRCYGQRPLAWLLDHHDIDERWCLIHCTHMTDGETRALTRSGAVAGLCPITEASLGDGIFKGEGFISAGGRIGVGSDSNIDISFFGELKMLEYSQRLRDRKRAVFATRDKSTGRALFDAVLDGGARAAGRRCGAIATGYVADLMAIDSDNHWFEGARGDERLDRMIFTGAPKALIRDVWSAGCHIVGDGGHLRRREIIGRFRSVLRELGA